MRRALALLWVLLVLGGCAEPALDEAPTADEAVEDASATAASGAAPVARSGNATDLGHMPHLHDYWSGKDRVTLFDDVIDPGENQDPFENLEPFLVDKEPKLGRTVWRLPDGAIVYEGTGTMEITATWDDPRVTAIALEYRSGVDAEFGEPLPLPHGETLSIPITPEMTDMPHMSTSRWVFGWEPADAPGAALGPFNVKIDIVRVADVMLFPGHPELFEGKPEKVLHDLDHEQAEVSYAKRVPNLATQGDFGEKTVSPQKVVPMETKAMQVEVTVLDTSATPGVVSDIRFFYHGADTTFLGHPYVIPYEGSFDTGVLVYRFPVTMEQTDTPYGEQSQWVFFVEPVTKFVGADEEGECGGCTDVSIKYHLKVVAYDHDLDGYSMMEGDEEGAAE